ncbi:MAG: AAA family ATPase, partial [Gaiellaceae bacterium]
MRPLGRDMRVTQAATPKPRARLIRRERPIIERPRLIKKLDASEAHSILLVAPAGYGKTTLARQWARTLSRVVWVSLTTAHRDVAVLARDVARSLEAFGDAGFVDFMDQYLQARQSPQREAREIAGVIADSLTRARIQWVVLDDYHELARTVDAEALVETIRAHERTRLLVASRVRPTWANGRLSLYGAVTELGRSDLAMDKEESALVVGRRDPKVNELVGTAEGWPAILALAASVDVSELPPKALPEALH